MTYRVFDMEVFPTWWCLVYKDHGEHDHKVIRSDSPTYKADLLNMRMLVTLVGFNIKGYDLRILNAIDHDYDPAEVYEVSQSIIADTPHPFNDFTFWNTFNFTDLYDDWLFGSLKEFEANSGMSIMETTVPFDKKDLTEEDKLDIIKYCVHDVDATDKLLDYRASYLEGKLALAEMFNIPKHTALKSTNAKLDALVLNAVPEDRLYSTQYVIPERVTDYILKWLPANVVNAFSKISYDKKVEKVEKSFILFNNMVVFGVGGIHSTLLAQEDLDHLKTVYNVSNGDALSLKIHKELKKLDSANMLVKTEGSKILKNIDVTSYYPNLIMHFGYMSRSVPDPSLYKYIYDLRVKLKKEAKAEKAKNGQSDLWKKLNAQQNGLKLVLNTTYGACKNKYNALYDPYQASSLCYTGQLLLSALATEIWTKTHSDIIQTNTDGLLIRCERTEFDTIKQIVSTWENLVRFTMEYDNVMLFFQRDVNNYIEVTDDEKAPYKLKGKWCNQAGYDPTNPNRSLSNLNAPITHQAILEYYTKGTPVRETIMACNNLYDFCFTTKTGHTYDKTYHIVNGECTLANKVNRCIATTDKSYGAIYKYKRVAPPENPTAKQKEQWEQKKKKWAKKYTIPFGRMDKCSDIPEHAFLVNDTLEMVPHLDKEWYIAFAEKKIKELRCI